MTEIVKSTWNDEDELTEEAACGIAILLVEEMTEYTVIRRSRKKTGVDYFLGFKESEIPFQDSARLEVSGILSGVDSKIRSRIKEKVKQIAPSDDGILPAYVTVIEFSAPIAHTKLNGNDY